MGDTYFFDLYGTLVDIWTDEGKASLWRGAARFYSLCGAVYAPRELRERYLPCARTRRLCSPPGARSWAKRASRSSF